MKAGEELLWGAVVVGLDEIHIHHGVERRNLRLGRRFDVPTEEGL